MQAADVGRTFPEALDFLKESFSLLGVPEEGPDGESLDEEGHKRQQEEV